MERAVLAGEALADKLGILVDQNGHVGTAFARRSVRVLRSQ
jgi:hypothetical protein